MPVIHSKTVPVKHSAQQVFTFLTDFHNFKDLLPEDKIENWECTTDSCSFSITGMAALKLHISEKIPNSKVTYASEQGAKYKFNLTVNISETDLATSSCSIDMEYHINPFLNGMAEKPLTALINKMVEKLAAVKFA